MCARNKPSHFVTFPPPPAFSFSPLRPIYLLHLAVLNQAYLILPSCGKRPNIIPIYKTAAKIAVFIFNLYDSQCNMRSNSEFSLRAYPQWRSSLLHEYPSRILKFLNVFYRFITCLFIMIISYILLSSHQHALNFSSVRFSPSSIS
jgi:hypothetical protein